MLLPLSQLINALHTLKNSATASIQTLNRDLISEHNSHLREVRCDPDTDLWGGGAQHVVISHLDHIQNHGCCTIT